MDTTFSEQAFDLNIERVLEHWTVAYGLREVIANALDEAALTNTPEPEIFVNEMGLWHIRDFGRGLQYYHLTQNENAEKLLHPDKVIGKFGVGLKDAFATFDRHHIELTIRSPHGDMHLGKQTKHGFTGIETLHVFISPPGDPSMHGTEFILKGLQANDIERAKSFFYKYSGETVLEQSRYGSIIQNQPQQAKARIYVNGLRVAEEDRFLFSYNITSPTSDLLKALNRERSHVGRMAYTDRVKKILLESQSLSVAMLLAKDLQQLELGKAHDELQWLDIQMHACRILNAKSQVIFVTADQLLAGGSLISHARDDGYEVVVIPISLATKLPTLKDIQGKEVRTVDVYSREWNSSFSYTFVETDQLTSSELEIYNQTPTILRVAGISSTLVREVRISETMRLDTQRRSEALGVWESDGKRIVIKRSQLWSLTDYAATLLHECAHALSRADDLTQGFEEMLTKLLGKIYTSQRL